VSVTVESDALLVRITPKVGGTITEVLHKPTGLSVLGQVPWTAIEDPLPGPARDEPEWLTRYTGGWPLLFPNAGDACTVDGTFHGFHGEASISPWTIIESQTNTLVLDRHFTVIPAHMRRTITVTGDTLSIREDLTYSGEAATDVMWGHHPSFGSDLLDGPVEITSGATEMRIEPAFAPPEGADLLRPSAPLASLAYLTGFDTAWAAIRRLDDAIAVHLSWDGARFPCAWLWHELEATTAAPWSGRTRLIAIEPNTTPCGLGLAEAKRRGAPLLRLEPGQHLTSDISLRVFKPQSASPS
jgi:galactose mutarotase-like enzyme